MKSTEMGKGRVFVLTLETGESIKTEIESFCKANGVVNAKVTLVGGIASGSTFVCGPQLVDGKETAPISPITFTTFAPTEFTGAGTVFPNESGEPILHLHGTLGRNGMSVTGCFREKAYRIFDTVGEKQNIFPTGVRSISCHNPPVTGLDPMSA